ncbi:MAG: 6-bladed beta-propeller, partial [Proteiniphilum sp.]|nr:6-bladed beta-propeller [Proteiniphilum sp.]
DGGRLLSVESLPKSFEYIFKTRDGYVGYMGNLSNAPDESKNVSLLSDDLKIEKSFFDIDLTWESNSFGDGYVFSSFNGTVHYIEPMDFNVYAIDGQEVSIPYRFDLGNLAWPEKAKAYKPFEELMDKDMNRYIHRIYYFQETENRLIIHVLYRGQMLLGIYDKRTKESVVSRTDAYIGNYFVPGGRIEGIDKNEIYLTVSAEFMREILVGKTKYVDFEAEYPEQVKRLRAEFPVIEEDGNPFLAIYYLK